MLYRLTKTTHSKYSHNSEQHYYIQKENKIYTNLQTRVETTF